MRVSTAQFYFQNSQQLSNKQSDVNEQVGYLSSGKRIHTAKDDAVGYSTLAGYKDELANIEKYQRNIIQAESRNTLQELSFSSAEDVLQQLKQLFIQANNGTLNQQDLTSLADLAKNSQSELLDIANKKDESGNYIFSGYQVDVKPFSLQPDNSVVYQGDNGVRELQIAKNVFVELNQSGDDAFDKITNSKGDFSATYNTNTSGISLNRAVIVDRGSYDSVSNPADYNFNFTSATDLTVTDSLGATVFSTSSYNAGQTIAFNGMEVQLSGNPLPGDNIDLTPNENISVFDTVKSAIDWINTDINASDLIKHQINYAEVLGQIDKALNHMSARRSDAGVRMKLIETQKNHHLDSELYLATGRSNIEDLDFAKAVATYEQTQVALRAAQQTFAEIKDLTLFNYI